jgi:tetratricopeptide (TPR) repeat protein/2-polyprenyl-3-methyl-5-hydroxy-6-metoxy-1,4-benzoquinol methylase
MELTIEKALQKAIEAHKIGNLYDAEILYRAILKEQPKHSHANHNLGLIAFHCNKIEESLLFFQIALEVNPKEEQFWYSYIKALIEANQMDNAIKLYNELKNLGLNGQKIIELESHILKINNQLIRKEKTLTKKDKIKILQKEEELLIKHFNNAKYKEGEELSKVIIKKNPSHQLSWKVLGAIYQKNGELNEAENAHRRALILSPRDAIVHRNLGVTLQELGKIQEAERSFKVAIKLKPQYAESYYNLGCLKLNNERLEEAVENFKKSIILKANYEEAYFNLGIVYHKIGKYEDAKLSYKKVIEINPNFSDAYSNLGNILKENGELKEAEKNYQIAIDINPLIANYYNNFANFYCEIKKYEQAQEYFKKAINLKNDFIEPNFNLGCMLFEQGKLLEAEVWLRNTIKINPNYAEAYNNIGIILQENGKLLEAEEKYKKAIEIKPNLEIAHSNLVSCLLEGKKQEAALNVIINYVNLISNPDSKNLFVLVTKNIKIIEWNKSLVQLVIKAFDETWGNPNDLMPYACKLLKNNQNFKSNLEKIKENKYDTQELEKLIFNEQSESSSLIRAMMFSCPIPDHEIETLLAIVRRSLLEKYISKTINEAEKESIVVMYSYMAVQCFINEYIYYKNDEEKEKCEILLEQLENDLKEEKIISPILVILVACYFPLYLVKGMEKLLKENWSNDIVIVINQQIREPIEENNLRKNIPKITAIENKISIKVQQQYEENPYPRWMNIQKERNIKSLNSYIQDKFPFGGFTKFLKDDIPEILIAGCGTGQHPISVAQQIKGANILAIDLSLSSLAYAKRKTKELEISSIFFAQADINKLKEVKKKFDVIESSGVLHHLENPNEGFEILISMLKPYGLIKLGLYSEIARRDITKIRELIKYNKIGRSKIEIINFRKYLIDFNQKNNFGFATSSIDFFSTSNCNDLLFNVQEHQINIKIINEMVKKNSMKFLGFEIERSVNYDYKKLFPDDLSSTNLENWNKYEEINKDTFSGMYQFWLQKMS